MSEPGKRDVAGAEQESGSLAESLPYRVDLWTEDRGTIDHVLARVTNATLAHAIFSAAKNEHPDRYITLRHGADIILSTS